MLSGLTVYRLLVQRQQFILLSAYNSKLIIRPAWVVFDQVASCRSPKQWCASSSRKRGKGAELKDSSHSPASLLSHHSVLPLVCPCYSASAARTPLLSSASLLSVTLSSTSGTRFSPSNSSFLLEAVASVVTTTQFSTKLYIYIYWKGTKEISKEESDIYIYIYVEREKQEKGKHWRYRHRSCSCYPHWLAVSDSAVVFFSSTAEKAELLFTGVDYFFFRLFLDWGKDVGCGWPVHY